MDLIRALLLQLEGEEQIDLSCWTEDQKVYHMALAIQAGLVDGSVIKDHLGKVATTVAIQLTWNGHEFLDAARDDTVWKKVRERLGSVGANVAWPVLTALLTDLAKKRLGIP